MAEINDDKLSSDLNECKIKLNNSEKENGKLSKNITSLNLQYSNCQTNLNSYISYYQTCQNTKSNLQTQVNNLSSQITQWKNNYNSCYNQLAYYSNLQDENKNLKEKIEQLNQSINSCNADLDLWIDSCYLEYQELTQEMKSTINELIVYSYNSFSDFEKRATYISERMHQIYNKAYWSVFLVKTNSYYGYYVWNFTKFFYTYTYKSINWIVFIGTYY